MKIFFIFLFIIIFFINCSGKNEKLKENSEEQKELSVKKNSSNINELPENYEESIEKILGILFQNHISGTQLKALDIAFSEFKKAEYSIEDYTKNI